MPAVTEPQKRALRVNNRLKKLQSYIRELIRERDKTQGDCATVLGITQAGFSVALKNMTFSATSLIALFDFLGADPEDISAIMARK